MAKNYTFKIDASISRILNKYNSKHPEAKFNATDVIILSLVKSFYNSKTDCFISARELSILTLSSESTVRRSIKRLRDAKLISREVKRIDGIDKYILIYNPGALGALLF